MRLVVGILACLGLAALTAACATGPAQSQASPTATATPSASAPAAATAAQPAADGAKVAEVSAKEKHFLSEGYKPRMHGGEKVFCKRESVLGSRVDTELNCGTLDQLDAAERGARADVEQAQRQQSSGPSGR